MIAPSSPLSALRKR